MYLGCLCLLVLTPSLSSASVVIFLFYLVCLIFKVFRLCVVFPSGLDVSSSLLTWLTQSFFVVGSYRISLPLSACACLPSWAPRVSFHLYLSLPPFLAFFAYLFHTVCAPIDLNKPHEANKTTFCPFFPKSGCMG